MYFYLIGTDYKSATLTQREYFYGLRKEIASFWRDKEAAVLSTCNRIEIYGVSLNADTAFSYIFEFSKEFPDFSKYAYLKYGETEVFRHTLRLASGLESQIEGEPQILLQLQSWLRQEWFPLGLKEIWVRALAIAEDIRIQSGLNQGVDNIGKVVLYDLSKHLALSKPSEVVVVGTGKIAELLAGLPQPHLHLNFVAHKNYQRAKELAGISGGKAFLLKDLARLLKKADALISATTSPHYILKKDDFLGVRKPFYIYDLALPRDIQPDLKDLPGIFLKNLDDLNAAIKVFNQKNRAKVQSAGQLVEEIVKDSLEAAYVENS